ncbi:MAG: hypothetical protein HS111_28860 [Kofleriaceae bacterium]|nr:hypothetical protein [Kofleriaceae bacterium]
MRIDGGTLQNAAVVGTTWSFTAAALSDGVHSVQVVSAFDEAGNVAVPESQGFQVDTIGPALAFPPGQNTVVDELTCGAPTFGSHDATGNLGGTRRSATTTASRRRRGICRRAACPGSAST